MQPPPYAGTRNKVRYFQILMTHSLKNWIVPLSMPTLLFTTERNQMFLNSYLKLSLLDIGLRRHLLDNRIHPIRQLFVSIKSLRIGIFKRYFYFITNTKKKTPQIKTLNTWVFSLFHFSNWHPYTCQDGLLHFTCLSIAYWDYENVMPKAHKYKAVLL